METGQERFVRWFFVVFTCVALSFAAYMAACEMLAGQTKITPDQLAPTVAVVYWSRCSGSGTKPDGTKWDCTGLELYRFRLADGSLRGPYIAFAADKSFVEDAKWVPVPLR
jgi:hypothetical protein